TLTPMMCSRILKSGDGRRRGRFYRAVGAVFDKMIAFYGRTLRMVLRFQVVTLLVAAATLVLTVYLYIAIPKGLFPVQDTGVIQGISQAPETISFTAMAERQRALARVVLQDPAVQSLSSFIGVDGTNTTLNSGRMSINLKAPEVRNISAVDVIRRLNNSLRTVEGIRLYMQPVQNITVDNRVSRTQYQFTLEDPDDKELHLWANRVLSKLEQLPELADVATDQQPGGRAVLITMNRITASRLGIAPATVSNTLYDAFGQRQINTLYTQLNQYRVILESEPVFQRDQRNLAKLYIQANSSSGASGPGAANTFSSSGSATAGSNSLTSSVRYTPSSGILTPPLNALKTGVGSTTATSASSPPANSNTASSSAPANAVPLNGFSIAETTASPLSINRQGQFPAVTISFNLAARTALGTGISAIDRAQNSLHLPASLQAGFQGTAAAFKNSLTNEWLLLLAALVTVYIV
ncbi:MAG: efflux RND transporter permease subunit, partial [Acidobacteria bacterium Pan2503]|nr:efflux RND transporter permease subunit [Candidatus Acidoferrum panamensis]